MFKKFSVIVAALALSVCMYAQPSGWEWKESKKGPQYGSLTLRMFDSDQTISAVRYPAAKFHTIIANDPGYIKKRCCTTTTGFGFRYGGQAAINGSYFNMRTQRPTTYIRDNGRVEGTTQDAEKGRTTGLLVINGKECLIFPTADTLAHKAAYDKAKDVMAAGPVLMQNGAVLTGWPEGDGFYSNRHPRSIVGVSADGYVYFIVIDGRHEGNAEGATIAEAAAIAELFGLKDALNLDGGGSSALWVKNQGVISHPSDNRSFDEYGERRIPNAIIVK